MDALKNEYQIIKSEIERYFDFIKYSQYERSTIVSESPKTDFLIDESTKKILKASSFLLLYNLIEATVRKCIISIYESIHNQKLNYRNLSNEVQLAWLKSHEKMLRDCKSESFPTKLKEKVVQICVLDEPLKFSESLMKQVISGNLNSESIKLLCYEYGIEVLKECKKLDDVKDKRNKLAHGENSFSEIGRDYTFEDIVSIKDEVVKHLDMVVGKIEEFILKKKYKTPTTRKKRKARKAAKK